MGPTHDNIMQYTNQHNNTTQYNVKLPNGNNGEAKSTNQL